MCVRGFALFRIDLGFEEPNVGEKTLWARPRHFAVVLGNCKSGVGGELLDQHPQKPQGKLGRSASRTPQVTQVHLVKVPEIGLDLIAPFVQSGEEADQFPVFAKPIPSANI